MAQFEQQWVHEVTFNVNGTAIVKVSKFKYLGNFLEESDNDNLAANQQLNQAWAKWGWVGKVLSNKDASPAVMSYFYKAIV